MHTEEVATMHTEEVATVHMEEVATTILMEEAAKTIMEEVAIILEGGIKSEGAKVTLLRLPTTSGVIVALELVTMRLQVPIDLAGEVEIVCLEVETASSAEVLNSESRAALARPLVRSEVVPVEGKCEEGLQGEARADSALEGEGEGEGEGALQAPRRSTGPFRQLFSRSDYLIRSKFFFLFFP